MANSKAINFPVFICTSKYSQRMRKLSCKIFNEFYVPELPKQELEYGYHLPPIMKFAANWQSDMRVFERNQEMPSDLNQNRSHKYYPSHPQIRELTHTLREYGLYRDEHRDFNEEMKAVAIARGKVFRQRTGPIKKSEAKKK